MDNQGWPGANGPFRSQISTCGAIFSCPGSNCLKCCSVLYGDFMGSIALHLDGCFFCGWELTCAFWIRDSKTINHLTASLYLVVFITRHSSSSSGMIAPVLHPCFRAGSWNKITYLSKQGKMRHWLKTVQGIINGTNHIHQILWHTRTIKKTAASLHTPS